jgi:putative mRNA 3-end processing factor
MQYTVKILGGGQEVGRAGIEISNSSESIILDYGVNFNQKDEPNFPLQESPSKVSGFVISHAHLDHIGALPIYQISTTKKIYGTGITKYITELMLKDFIKLSGQKVPFEWVEVKKTMDNFETFNYWQETEIGPFTVTYLEVP